MFEVTVYRLTDEGEYAMSQDDELGDYVDKLIRTYSNSGWVHYDSRMNPGSDHPWHGVHILMSKPDEFGKHTWYKLSAWRVS